MFAVTTCAPRFRAFVKKRKGENGITTKLPSGSPNPTDVLVVGTGNAAFCAALAAQEQGSSVRMLDVAPMAEFGGNSRYTAGAMRFAYDTREDIMSLLASDSDPRLARTDFGHYTKRQFIDDFLGFNGQRPLTPHQHLVVQESLPLMRWLSSQGISFAPIYSRQAFEKEGRFKFWGGLTLCAEGEGEGLVQHQRALFEAQGGEICYDTEATSLIQDTSGVLGVLAQHNQNPVTLQAASVVLACGGYEASEALRIEHLGPQWRHARVRGSKFNQGHGITMAQAIGAATAGKFDGCHATPMDRDMPEFGNLDMPHLQRKNYRKISYPFGVMLNANGQRFVDEGANFRNYTYAQYGRAILEQPGHCAWQIFDAQVLELLYEEYHVEFATRVTADSLNELLAKMDGINVDAAFACLSDYNAAVDQQTSFDPSIKDGRGTVGLPLNKSNWANRIEQPPFVAYPVTCGITFSYGGLEVSLNGEVLDTTGNAINGLFACGELVGNLFFDGYPGGTGLTAGGVFGRAAGYAAARYSQR